jgi:hypothetical protein
VLRPAIVKAIIDGVFKALNPSSVGRSVRTLTKDLRTLDLKIANLTAAIEDGAVVALLVTKLHERQAERNALVAEIGAAEAMQNVTVDRQAIERRILAKMANWRTLLEGNIAERRQFLREAIDGPIYFKPEGDTYRFTGIDRRGQLITDLVVTSSTLSGVPTGIRMVIARGCASPVRSSRPSRTPLKLVQVAKLIDEPRRGFRFEGGRSADYRPECRGSKRSGGREVTAYVVSSLLGIAAGPTASDSALCGHDRESSGCSEPRLLLL